MLSTEQRTNAIYHQALGVTVSQLATAPPIESPAIRDIVVIRLAFAALANAMTEVEYNSDRTEVLEGLAGLNTLLGDAIGVMSTPVIPAADDPNEVSQDH